MNIYKNNYGLVNQFIPQTIENLTKTQPHDGHVSQTTSPAFYGCYDWHSSVHSHWQVIRAMRLFPQAAFVENAKRVIKEHITTENIKKETANVPPEEVPYGIAWVLLLAQELREWKQTETNSRILDNVQEWVSAIKPLENYSKDKLLHYMQRQTEPNRTGEHDQTALSLLLAWDWAQVSGNDELIHQIHKYATDHYPSSISKPHEPKNNQSEYFLSPGLSEADLLRRVLKPDDFVEWVQKSYFSDSLKEKNKYDFINPPENTWNHIYGLNMSRAFMATGVSSELRAPYSNQLLSIAVNNGTNGINDALNKDFGVSHWVPTYLMYYITARGLSS